MKKLTGFDGLFCIKSLGKEKCEEFFRNGRTDSVCRASALC